MCDALLNCIHESQDISFRLEHIRYNSFGIVVLRVANG